MSISQTGNRLHDAAVTAAEAARQVAVSAAGNSQSSVQSAEIAFYRAALASAKANGLSTAIYATALRELGVNT
ncbi:MAG: hypothetical protein U1E81_16140 [Xanthobacteraceae bacterium]